MPIKLLFDPARVGRPMRLAAFMSGSGTNVTRLIEWQKRLAEKPGPVAFELVFIFSDRSDGRCRGEALAREAGIPYLSYDVRKFHEDRGLKRTVATAEGLAARRAYDWVAEKVLRAFGVDCIALGGYMSFLTLPGCVNVHPADLSLTDEAGQRLFVGDNAVRDAIAAGQTELRSSTIWTDLGVDSGPLLMVSDPIPVELPAPLAQLQADPARLQAVADEHQDRLKEKGDWVVFPLTIQHIAEGRFGLDEAGLVYFDGRPAPQRGVRP